MLAQSCSSSRLSSSNRGAVCQSRHTPGVKSSECVLKNSFLRCLEKLILMPSVSLYESFLEQTCFRLYRTLKRHF